MQHPPSPSGTGTLHPAASVPHATLAMEWSRGIPRMHGVCGLGRAALVRGMRGRVVLLGRKIETERKG